MSELLYVFREQYEDYAVVVTAESEEEAREKVYADTYAETLQTYQTIFDKAANDTLTASDFAYPHLIQEGDLTSIKEYCENNTAEDTISTLLNTPYPTQVWAGEKAMGSGMYCLRDAVNIRGGAVQAATYPPGTTSFV